ncbi:MAG: S10 family peptidase [Gammaproteobacteria bacterium]
MKIKNPILLSLFTILLVATGAAEAKEMAAAGDQKAPEKPAEEEPMHFESQGSVRIDGKSIDYTATAGTLVMKNDKDQAIAQFGYTAYVKNDTNKSNRPIMFAYNGGPGSASLWLHMGILGPKRVLVEDLSFNTSGPFKRGNNEYSILAQADLVMIDPVGTGFSRAVGETEGKEFWGVDQDIASVSDFIARYVTDNGRWQSAKYLLGESYGGIRSGGVAYYLMQRHSISLNGVILVSPYMSFVAGNSGIKIDLPQVNFFTTFAATAWYHKTIEDRPDDLQQFLRQAEAFAVDEYAPLLHKGSRATDRERKRVLAGMERFTGISADYWDKANLRIDEGRFAKELLRERGQVVGRIDSRFTGHSISGIAESMNYDPFFPAVGPAFTATFNDYYREELGVKTDRKYVTSGGLWTKWDQAHSQPGANDYGKLPIANTGVDLTHAMIQNPNMRVLVQQGYYDLATPYGATDYFLDHMELPEELRGHITLEHYEAGHMMYLHPKSLKKFSRDLSEFVQ